MIQYIRIEFKKGGNTIITSIKNCLDNDMKMSNPMYNYQREQNLNVFLLKTVSFISPIDDRPLDEIFKQLVSYISNVIQNQRENFVGFPIFGAKIDESNGYMTFEPITKLRVI